MWNLWEFVLNVTLSKTIGILARLRHFVPTETLLMIHRWHRDLCMGSRSQVIHWQTTCSPKTSASTDLFCAQWCSCYSSFHSINDFTSKYDLFWRGCKFHSWYLGKKKKLAPSPIRALFTRSNEIHGYNTRHATKGNYLRKEVKSEIFKNWSDIMESNFSKLERFI